MPTTEARRQSLAALPDSELVNRCREGQELAWDVLVKRYRRLVYAVPHHARLGEDEVEDVFQQTFARLAERIRGVRDPARIRAWIVTTAKRLTIDAIRRRRNLEVVAEPEALAEHPSAAPLPPEVLEAAERHHLVRQALLRLGDRCQALLTLLFYHAADQPPSYETVSEELGMPVGSIGPTRARCLQRLLGELQRLEGED